MPSTVAIIRELAKDGFSKMGRHGPIVATGVARPWEMRVKVTAVTANKSTPFPPHPIRSKGGFKALPPKAIS